ncbi:hypothetical protein Btru_001755 [Bulinus truncatus]|nr:hypothetical protein Btru_001755 [Bulinus truncatus]
MHFYLDSQERQCLCVAIRVQLIVTNMVMGEDNNLNLASWLRKLIQERAIQRLTWIEESENTFVLPWSNQKKKDWTPFGDDSKLLIEWAKHKYGYREGDEENISKWKTNLRCAINKCPNIVRLKTMDTDSYLVCQFKHQYPERTSSTLSSSSEASQTTMEYFSAASVASSAMSEMDYLAEDGNLASPRNNLPIFVQDLEMSSLSDDSNFDDRLSNSEYFPQDVNFNDVDYPLSETCTTVQYVQHVNHNRPAPADAVHTPPIAENNEKFIMILEISYDVPHRPVMCMSITADKPKLQIVSGYVDDTKKQNQIYKPDEFRITLPSTDSLQDLPEANISKINDILKNFTRGVSIDYRDDNIYIERNSKVKIFATNEVHWCQEIKRKQRSGDPPIRVNIFDLKKFRTELFTFFKDRSQPCPKDYVILTIGMPCSLDKPSPLSSVLVSIKIRHVQASYDLKMISDGNNATYDPMISGGDSLDRSLEEDMKKIAIL